MTEVTDYVKDNPGRTAAKIAAALDRMELTTRTTLDNLVVEGELVELRGRYYCKEDYPQLTSSHHKILRYIRQGASSGVTKAMIAEAVGHSPAKELKFLLTEKEIFIRDGRFYPITLLAREYKGQIHERLDLLSRSDLIHIVKSYMVANELITEANNYARARIAVELMNLEERDVILEDTRAFIEAVEERARQLAMQVLSSGQSRKLTGEKLKGEEPRRISEEHGNISPIGKINLGFK